MGGGAFWQFLEIWPRREIWKFGRNFLAKLKMGHRPNSPTSLNNNSLTGPFPAQYTTLSRLNFPAPRCLTLRCLPITRRAIVPFASPRTPPILAPTLLPHYQPLGPPSPSPLYPHFGSRQWPPLAPYLPPRCPPALPSTR